MMIIFVLSEFVLILNLEYLNEFILCDLIFLILIDFLISNVVLLLLWLDK